MSTFSLEKLTTAVENASGYHFRVEHIPSLAYEGDIDLASDRQRYRINLEDERVPQVEVLWEGRVGVGRRINGPAWWPLDGRPLGNPLVGAAAAIRDGRISSVTEQDGTWRVEFEPNRPAFLEQPEAVARRVAGCRRGRSMSAFISRFVETSKSIVIRGVAMVSRESYLITDFRLDARAANGNFQFHMLFMALRSEIPPSSLLVTEPVLRGPRLRAELLLLTLPHLGGWDAPTEHAPWAQRSIQLIGESDQADRRYAEVYEMSAPGAFAQVAYPVPKLGIKGPLPDETKHHPIILGAWHEDNTSGLPSFYNAWFTGQPSFLSYFGQGAYGRYYHHFGGDADGLEYKDYMSLASAPKCPTLTSAGKDSYYSARDWGYGLDRLNGLGGESLNRLTFTRAIEQYHRYDWEGKRNAYLLLGHVVHLLQDNGEPDHALLTAHPASGMNDPESDTTFHRCHIAAGIAAGTVCAPLDIICEAIVFGIAFGSCEATVDEDEVGYERLVMDAWRLDQAEAEVKKTGVMNQANYDAYFHAVSQAAQKALGTIETKYPSGEFSPPLGCGEFVGIPGLDPFIDVDDDNETQPYIELTDAIAPQVVGLTAGLIEHFYDVVNYPPYVKRLVIVQWEPTGIPHPKTFGQFAVNKLHCVRYDTEWIDAAPSSRNLIVHKKQYLTTDRPAFVFVQFGPAGIGPTLSKDMREVHVRVTGNYPGNSTPLSIDIQMQRATDNSVGPYYWGSFSPRNCCKDPYMLTFEISGKDAGPHFKQRQPSGDELDSEPATMARVDISLPTFNWLDYSPGIDKHHTIMVSRFDWQLDVSPQPLIIPRSRRRATELTIELRQRFADCNCEPTWGVPTCAVDWKLLEDITWLTNMATGSAEDFGLAITREVRHNAMKLRIECRSQRVKPGVYRLQIEYTLGEPPVTHVVTPTFQIV